MAAKPTIGLSTGSPKEELEKGPKELKGFAAPQEEQQYEPTRSPRALRDKTTNQRIHMVGFIAPEANVAEDGLVDQWEEKPSECEGFMPQCRRMPGPGIQSR